ncbi:MAG: hypothetical protein ACI8RD_007035 [Bacillariaceae sp.]|jgi:hypothetical protein
MRGFFFFRKTKFAEIENGRKNDYKPNDTTLILRHTFSLVSIHLLIAWREEPVRSFISKIAFLTIIRVAILMYFVKL